MHARFATHFSRRGDDVQRLLEEGTGADLGPRWNAVVAASVELPATPAALEDDHVAVLGVAGLGDFAISDALHGAAFFNWANRLMLSLGEPQEAAAV